MNRPEIIVAKASWHEDREAIARIRELVFVREQGVPLELEWDGLDQTAIHLLARDNRNQIIGTARLLPSGQIGRMAVLPSHRNLGAGRALLAEAIKTARELGHEKIFLNAQTKVLDFYRPHGFKAVGPGFSEAGIAHQRMELSLQP